MKNRIKTLLLDANGYGWRAVLADTAIQGFLGLKADTGLPVSLRQHPLARRLLRQRNESVSYVIDWREALCEAPELDVEVCNINNLVQYFRCLKSIAQYPLIIILHSTNSNDMSLLLKTADWFNRRRGKLVIFIGNEYKLMAEKIGFIRSVNADYVCSQLPLEAARWLYTECSHSQILPMPHALNPKLYHPSPHSQRTIDIGFIGVLYHNVIGDMERTNLIRFFQTHGAALGLACDIRLGAYLKLPRAEWAQFLNTCKGIIGAEAGTYYLDRTGQVIADAKAYLKAHPTASFEEIFERFFRDHPSRVSGKAISSRHFEPIGTKTCQILLEGYYNGTLVPDEHYISLKKDFLNIDDVVRRFKDDNYRQAMVEQTYEYVMAEHTYRHRVESLLKAVVDSGF
jgi:hypothetical protein